MLNKLKINENNQIQQIDSDLLKRKNIFLGVKRDDLLLTPISENKWRKLKYNLAQMQALKKTELLTFGGIANSPCLVFPAKKTYHACYQGCETCILPNMIISAYTKHHKCKLV